MEAVASPVNLHRPLPPEEAARGNFYALLARLFHGGPDQALLRELAAAPPLPAEGNAQLAAAWQALVDASSAMDADAAAEEYEKLFVGLGKAQVSIYSGYYTGAPAIDHPRVGIQAELAALGLERRRAAEPEDHYAGILDVMRVLVAGGAGRAPAALAEQKRFYEEYVKPGFPRFLAAVGSARDANYYRRVAGLAAAFAALESESFQLD